MNALTWCLGGIFAFCLQSTGHSIESKYLFQKSPKRIALVVGNSEYQNFDKLPGSAKDVDRISKILTSLGFSVTPVLDVKTSTDFQYGYLVPFLDKIDEGTFVVFYFSGHGFTYNDESYLVPTLFPKQLTIPVYEAAIPATTVLARISARPAALSVMILDACREEFDIKKYVRPQDKDFVKKGFADASAASNQIISYAAHPGLTAAGSSIGDASPYTDALAKYIAFLDAEWSDVAKDVTFDVRHNTPDAQSPWFSESNTTYVWFNASAKTNKLVQERWESALKRSTVSEVERFAAKYAVSPYAAAAQLWLKENRNREVAHITQVSPVLADAQWSTNGEAKTTQLTGPLALDRSISIAHPDSTDSTPLLSSASTADILREAGQVVLLRKTVVRSAPFKDAKIVKTYGFGTKLRVLGTDDTGAWLKVSDARLNVDLYLAIPPNARTKPISLGEPIREVLLGPRMSDVPGLVDAAALQSNLREIRDAGWKITWVSIAAPRAASDKQRELLDAMSTNALLLLTDAGLPRGKITTVRGVDFGGTDIRLRFFGKRPPKGTSNAR
jgi:uncharacterized caspase-like protein